MSEKKHTPWPWTVDKKDRFAGAETVKIMHYGYEVASLWTDRENDTELYQNANLIAAAPDMLEMLKRLSESITNPATKIELSDLINRAKNG